MKKNNRITPEGTKDYLFEECRTRRKIEKTLDGVFASHGFHEVVTPGLEFYDVFDPDYSGVSQEVMFKLTDRLGRIMVMRPDSTLPIARLTATRLQNQIRPIRLFYTQPIYRSHPGLSGRYNENIQTGIELLGADGLRADLEVVVTAVEALSKCIPNYRLELGHAGFFKSLAKRLPVSDEVREDIRCAVESKNYAALNVLLDRLEDSAQVRAVRELPRLFGGEEVFEKAAPFCGTELKGTLNYLHALYRSLSEFGLGDKLIVDLGLVQRNDYYTGVVFSSYVEECGDAVMLGGRYDNLLEHFGSPMPAVGFGIDVDALTGAVLSSGGGRSSVRPADVLVHGDDGYEVDALKYMSRLTAQGLCCENSVFGSHAAAVNYAGRAGIGRVDFVGENTTTVKV